MFDWAFVLIIFMVGFAVGGLFELLNHDKDIDKMLDDLKHIEKTNAKTLELIQEKHEIEIETIKQENNERK